MLRQLLYKRDNKHVSCC